MKKTKPQRIISAKQFRDLFGNKARKQNKPKSRTFNKIDEIIYYDNGFFALAHPLSVNEAWRGKRFKSDAYRSYVKAFRGLKKFPLPKADSGYKISFVFGVNNMQKDWDNPIKPLQDIVCNRLAVNDAHIHWGEAVKVQSKREFVGVIFEPVNKEQILAYLGKFKTGSLL